MPIQQKLAIVNPNEKVEDMSFDLSKPCPIKGYPELRWAGKRPFTSTHYYPAQLKERYGDPVDGWMNRIYWGDNLQVMSHLLKEFRSKVDLVYIDPPFDSKADYKKNISLHSKRVESDRSSFEEKQYSDIWTNDTYLQFIYERLIILRQLLTDKGCIYFHCDWHRSHFLRSILDEIFGPNNFINELIWKRSNPHGNQSTRFGSIHDNIFLYSKTGEYIWNPQFDPHDQEYIDQFYRHVEEGTGRRYQLGPLNNFAGVDRPNLTYEWNGYYRTWRYTKEKMQELEASNRLVYSSSGLARQKLYLDEMQGIPPQDLLLNFIPGGESEYPTQKPERLLERLILSCSNPGSIVLDCFMGSGTTQAVAMKLGRRFIGADINLGAIQTTTKRLNGIIAEQKREQPKLTNNQMQYLNFEVYNVNNYDIFRNPVQARDLLIQALEIDPLESTDVFDGMKDGYKVKIMPVNRIASRADLNAIISGINYRELDKAIENTPGKPADKIMLICMGHEPDLAAQLKMDIGAQYRLEVEVVDILRDRTDLTFKYDSEARIIKKGKSLVIEQFYPRNLLQKLSILDENVADWRELVETVAIDWNYNGEVLQPEVYDCPGKNEPVKGTYPIPPDHGLIRVKITDLLSESLELTVEFE